MNELDTIHQKQWPASHSESDDSDQADDERFSLCEYDLDVVDEALGHPDQTEFRDHFGFCIQVKTDDEADGESSDSDFSDQDSRIQNSSSIDHHQHGLVHSSEDDNGSVDTAVTTPTLPKQPSHLYQPVPTIPRRCRSATAPVVDGFENTNQQQQWRANSSSSAAATTILMQQNGRSRSESGSGLYFLRRRSPSPGGGGGGGAATMERPSQVFQERQTKRMSELARSPSVSSSAGSCSSSQSKRLTYANASSYYDMLKSKFGRSSEDHAASRDSVRHAALKAEARKCLENTTRTTTTMGKDEEEALEEMADYWKNFIDDPDTLFKTEACRVRQHMVAGVPSSLRGYLWQIMAKSRNNCELETEYKELLKRISPHEKAIQRDLARTFPSMDFFREKGGKGQELLFNVIKAYSLFDQQVGYCQGLPFIVGCLLLNMSDEMAFSVLVKLMSQYGLRNQFTPNMELLQERLYQFNHLLQEMLPQVYDHLIREGVDASMYASQWLLTLFAYKCPIQLTFRVFDVFFLEGSTVLLRFALALMFRNQQTLLGLEFDSLVDFLNNGVYSVYKEDENGFVQDAYHIDISPRVLARLSKQYQVDAARAAKAQSQEEQLRKTNVELASKLRTMEKAYETLEKDHREVVAQVIDSKMHVAKVDDENQQIRCQLAQVRAEVAKLKSTIPVAEDLQKRNAQLQERNHALHNQVADLEVILATVTRKYAECESAYEEMQQRLSENRIA